MKHGHQQQQQGWGNQPPQQQGWGNQPPPQQQGWGGNQGFNQPSLFNANQDYVIVSGINKNKALDVSQGSDKGKCLIWSKHGKQNQRYRIRPVGNGRYQIQSNAGGVLQVVGGSAANGVRL
jgi:hypothetical protein